MMCWETRLNLTVTGNGGPGVEVAILEIFAELYYTPKGLFQSTVIKFKTFFVTSKDSDQPVHPPSTARVLVYPSFDNPEAVKSM